MGLVSGTGTAQLHKASHASVTTQLLQVRDIAQWSQSHETHRPVLPPPPGTCPRKVPARRLALAGTSMLPEFMTLYTAYSSTRGAGLSVPGSPGPKCFPHPSKETLSVFPYTQPWQPSFSMAHHHKTSCILRKIHKELFHMIFFYQNLSLGFPKHTHEDLWIGLLTRYITTATGKCHWFKFFDARSEKQEVAEKIFISKQLNKLTKNIHYNSTVSFETTSV